MCRDYLRNVCKRGKKCKFFHPDGMPPKTTTELIFCHDFQNKECSRQRCKFIHCSREEEEHFRLTGELKLTEVSFFREYVSVCLSIETEQRVLVRDRVSPFVCLSDFRYQNTRGKDIGSSNTPERKAATSSSSSSSKFRMTGESK